MSATDKLHAALSHSPQHAKRLAQLLTQSNPDKTDDCELPAFTRVICSISSLNAIEARAIFERHAQRTMPRTISARAFAAAFAPAAPPPASAEPPPARERRPTIPQAWEAPASQAQQPRQRISGSQPVVPVAAKREEIQRDASARAQLAEALDAEVAAAGARAALPRAERLTMHRRQADAAERQLVLLRLLRAIEPRAPALASEAALAEALLPLARRLGLGGRATSRASSAPSSRTAPTPLGGVGAPRSSPQQATASAAFLDPSFLRAAYARAGRGSLPLLLDELAPVPVVRSSVAAANGEAYHEQPIDIVDPIEKGRAAGSAYPGAPSSSRVAAAGGAGGRSSAGTGGTSRLATGPPMLNGPFDRGDGKPGTERRGARHVPAPAELPKMIKYRHCRTPLLVPPGFEPALVTRSGQRPSYKLERVRIQGYNGLGKHNRSPNLFSLPDGRILFCTAGVAILEEPKTGEQSFYDGHDDDIVCVALHPNGELVATGQGATAGGASASLHVWSVSTRQTQAKVGRVLDEKVNDGVTTRPFYPGSLCAAAFGPSGRLLIGVGKDEMHLVGVWDWKKGELLAKANGMVARPLAVHQIAAAPYPLAEDAQGRQTMLFTLVGVSNAPKFGTLKPADAPGPTRWELNFEIGKLNVKVPPPSLSCVAYGGESFPSPSGLRHGLTFVGGAFGGIYSFDAPTNTVRSASGCALVNT